MLSIQKAIEETNEIVNSLNEELKGESLTAERRLQIEKDISEIKQALATALNTHSHLMLLLNNLGLFFKF